MHGFKIVAAFDIDPQLIGRNISGVIIQDVSELEATIKNMDIEIGLVAVAPGPGFKKRFLHWCNAE
jgi:redox-sensing transcriptional repressor